MRRAVVKIVALIVIVICAEAVFLLSPISREALRNSYLEAWRSKHARLHAPGTRRLVLVGGSNLAFGVDSARLEADMQRTVVNLGLHGGLGLRLMLNEALEGTRAGDLAVLVAEYEQFFGRVADGEITAVELLQYEPAALRFFRSFGQLRALGVNSATLSSRAAFAIIDDVKQSLLGAEQRLESPVYRSGAFNAHGDMVAHLDEASKPEEVARATPLSGDLNVSALRAVERWAEDLTSRGVEVRVLYPSVSASYWATNQQMIAKVAAGLAFRTTSGEPHDWVFEDAMFYDTSYHLNRDGRAIRTAQLSRILLEGF
jgi:hypothetical protein